MYLDWAILLFTLYYTFRRINMLEKLREKWDEILNYMKEEHDISSVSFRTWLLPLELYSFENNTLYILVPDDQNFRQYLEKKYLFLLQISIEEIDTRSFFASLSKIQYFSKIFSHAISFLVLFIVTN